MPAFQRPSRWEAQGYASWLRGCISRHQLCEALVALKEGWRAGKGEADSAVSAMLERLVAGVRAATVGAVHAACASSLQARTACQRAAQPHHGAGDFVAEAGATFVVHAHCACDTGCSVPVARRASRLGGRSRSRSSRRATGARGARCARAAAAQTGHQARLGRCGAGSAC